MAVFRPGFVRARVAETATRRGLLRAGAATGAATLTAGCAGNEPPSARPAPVILRVLGERSLSRDLVLDAWRTRYGDEVGVHPVPEAPPPLAGDAGRYATVRALIQERASGSRSAEATVAHVPLESVPGVAGALMPLSGAVRRARMDLKRFMPCALQPAYGLNGELYALPNEVDAGQVYFNRQHLKDAGIDFSRAGLDFERPRSTWEALRRVSLDLLTGRGARDWVPWNPAAGGPLEMWGWANGGAWLTNDGRRATFTRPENVDALAWLQRHAREIVAERPEQPAPVGSYARWGTDADRPERNPFLIGRTSLHFDSSRFVSTLAGFQATFPIGYVECPRRDIGAPLVTWTRASGYAIETGAPDRAFEALRFFVSEDAHFLVAVTEARGAPVWEGDGAGPPQRPARHSKLWYPAFSGQLSVDRFLAGRFRTGSKLLDEAHDHALEQLRHARPRERCLAAESLWPLLEAARDRALSGAEPLAALTEAQTVAQALLDERTR